MRTPLPRSATPVFMWLKEIGILNFKNITEANLEFCPGVNCLVGSNGMGKSNMLEAVWYLSMTRSFLRLPDSEVLRHGAESMMVRGEYAMDGSSTETVNLGFAPPRRKVLKRSGKEYKRLSQHIGTLPVVLVSPQDSYLITGAPEERRRLMDTVISQAEPLYLEALIQYGKALTQRNSMLKSGMFDPILAEGIEMQMETHARVIFETRRAWVEAVREPFARYYAAISGGHEVPSLTYESVLTQMSLRDALARNAARDQVLGYTTVGPHRDDLQMLLDGHDLRRLGSQGQMKTYTLALRLALFEYLHSRRGVAPILLLDDIFDKLDATRVANIMQLVSSSTAFGQIFITDTGREHIDRIITQLPGPYRLFEAREGSYNLLKQSDKI